MIAAHVEATLGIRLPPTKKSMVEARLLGRARRVGMSMSAYVEQLVHRSDPEEAAAFLDAITTNKTYFFRESEQLDRLSREFFPELLERRARAGRRRLVVWSAACSTGQEPFSLAILLAECGAGPGSAPPSRVLGTDVCTRVVEQARLAIYPESELSDMTPARRTRWFRRGNGEHDGEVRVAPELRSMVSLGVANLLEPMTWLPERPDVILVRNVFIYFDRATQLDIARRMLDVLPADGVLAVGLSESLFGQPLPVQNLGQSLYRKAASGA